MQECLDYKVTLYLNIKLTTGEEVLLMTIKEMEVAVGMTRANIRFYESEGLISPDRTENGYRVYSQEDLEVLKRIKLLRSLQISLEEIKELHNGTHELGNTLAKHLIQLEKNKKEIEHSQKVCQVMKDDGVQYQTLDAQHYLSYCDKWEGASNKEWQKDVLPLERIPVRRFFARMFDFYLYESLWNILMIVGFNMNIGNAGLFFDYLGIAMGILFMFILEPVLLCKFGTTFGKWILGIHILDDEGNKLSFKTASERTKSVLWHGVGCRIPIFSLVRMWKAYKECDYSRPLEWETGSVISLKDDKKWRTVVYCGVHLVIFGIVFLTLLVAQMPKHRGDITVAQFQENYDRLNRYHGFFAETLWEDEIEEDSTGIVIDMREEMEKPTVTFMEEDGLMTGLCIELKTQHDVSWLSSYADERMLCVLAFVCAQEEVGILSNEQNEIIEYLTEHTYENFEFEKYGIKVKYNIYFDGYTYVGDGDDAMFASEPNAIYSFKFEMKKE